MWPKKRGGKIHGAHSVNGASIITKRNTVSSDVPFVFLAVDLGVDKFYT